MARHLPIPPWFNETSRRTFVWFDRWDDEQRRKQGFWAGLRILPKANGRVVYLAWRHWPHLLCWQWMLTLEIRGFRPRLFKFLKSGPGVCGGLDWSLRLGWLVSLRYQRQASDRIAAFGEWRRTAPAILYLRDEAA